VSSARAPALAALLLVSLLFSFGAAEALLWLLTRRNAQGEESIRGVRLLPYHLPVAAVGKTLASARERQTYIVYDPDLGWSIRPDGRGGHGLYVADAAGLRVASAGSPVSPEPAPGALRVALFGDSFTHGDDVGYADTWGAVLERTARARGANLEVVNFGVGGYGMDQALLRFRKLGPAYHPELVVFGLQPENAGRNLNLVRPIYYPGTGLPFTKPRFLLEQGRLRLVNVPALPPEELPALLSDFEGWALFPDEFFYHPDDYRWRPWYRSRLLRFLISRARSRRAPADLLSPDTPSGALALALVEDFAREAAVLGARFVVLALPDRSFLEASGGRGPAGGVELLERVAAQHELVDTGQALRAGGSLDAIFLDTGHYTPLGHRLVGERLAAHLAGATTSKAAGIRGILRPPGD
jgi:hypothetical protein